MQRFNSAWHAQRFLVPTRHTPDACLAWSLPPASPPVDASRPLITMSMPARERDEHGQPLETLRGGGGRHHVPVGPQLRYFASTVSNRSPLEPSPRPTPLRRPTQR
jgi:hypothetical protein